MNLHAAPLIDDPRRLARSLGVAAVLGLLGGLCVWVFLRQMPGDRAVRYLFTGAIVLPGAIMALRQSSYLLDYFVVVVVFNRQLRRLLDWYDGAFDPFPPTSLTPQLLGMCMLLAILAGYRRFTPTMRRAGWLLAAAITYGLAMGIEYRFGALYATWDYLIPICVLFYAVLCRPDEKTVNRWMRTVAACGVLAAVYGFVQWSILPQWDEQWIMWSGMYSSMGTPGPFKIGIASTLESRGPAAWFFASAAVIMIARPQWRRPWGWPGVVLIIGALLLTTVRSSLGFLVLCLVLLSMMQRGQTRRQMLLVVAACFVALVVLLPYLPNSERIVMRVQSIGSLAEDRSFNTRVSIAQHGIGHVLAQPQGFGIGASNAKAGRVAGAAQQGVGDNGWLSLLADLGFPGAILYFMGLGLIIRTCWQRYPRWSQSPPYFCLGLAMLGATLVFMLIANSLTGPYGVMMWMAISPALLRYATPLHASVHNFGKNRIRIPPLRPAATMGEGR